MYNVELKYFGYKESSEIGFVRSYYFMFMKYSIFTYHINLYLVDQITLYVKLSLVAVVICHGQVLTTLHTVVRVPEFGHKLGMC